MYTLIVVVGIVVNAAMVVFWYERGFARGRRRGWWEGRRDALDAAGLDPYRQPLPGSHAYRRSE